MAFAERDVSHMETFNRLRAEGYIQYEEKFGMMLWSTDIYAAFNS
jgi:hypothetical protein